MSTSRWFRVSAVVAAAGVVVVGLADVPSARAADEPSAPTASITPGTPAGASVPDLSDDMVVVPTTPVTRPHLEAQAAETATREAQVEDQSEPGAVASSAAAPVVHRVSVSIATVTTTTADDSTTPPDDASVATMITQLHDYWWDESGGAVDVRLAAIERTSLARASCDPSAVRDAVRASAFGGAFASYRWAGTDEHLLVLTRETCGSSAFGTVGGGGGEIFSSVGTDTTLGVPVLLHEFGHNLGFGHAGAGMCRSTTGVDAPLSDFRHAADGDTSVACPVEEYGDFLDIMGYSVSAARPHLSTPQRLRAGFQVDVTTLSEPGTRQQLTVSGLGGAATGRAVQVVDPLSGDTYWFEYRTAVGPDASSAEFAGATPRCSSLAAKLVRCGLNGDRAVGEVRVLRAMPLFGSAVSTVAVAAGPVTAGDLGRRDTHLDAGEGFTSAGGGFTVAVRSTSPSKGAVLDVSLAGGAPTGTAPIADPTAGTQPVPQASGYDYSVGEPAILGSVPGTAGASYDKACTGGYAIAGDSGFFLTTAQACRTGISADGSIRGDAGYHGDIYYSNPRDPLSLILMRPGNDAHQDVIDPITGARPGSGLVIGWTRSVDQPAGYVIGKMGVDTGWTEGKVVGTARGPNGTSLLCTTARASAGDIGGPVWRTEGGNVRALGTVVGISDKGGACYRPIQETLYQYGASLPSFGTPQGRPSYGTFAPGMPAYAGTVTSDSAGRIIDKGDDWRR